MPTLFMELGQDLIVTPNGSLQLATGWDEVRQRILRRIFTNAQITLQNGTPITPDYIFDTAYGLSARVLVGQPLTQNLIDSIRQNITEGVMQDEAVAAGILPVINVVQSDINTLYINIQVTLANQTTGVVTLTLT